MTIYGSTNTQASSVFNEFQRLAAINRSMSFYIKGKDAISLSFVSNLPTSCKSNFQVKVTQGANLTPGKFIWESYVIILENVLVFNIFGLRTCRSSDLKNILCMCPELNK